MKRFVPAIISIVFVFAGYAGIAHAEYSPEYPRVANYFLNWSLNMQDAKDLSKWDVVILDMEVSKNSPEELKLIRTLNPNIKILAYVASQEIYSEPDNYQGDSLRRKFIAGINDAWWLRDSSGNKISHWPGTNMLNLSTDFNYYLYSFIKDNVYDSGYFDGVFLDNLWGSVNFVNNGDIDIDNDGIKDSASKVDKAWQVGMDKVLSYIRASLPQNFIVIGNGQVYFDYQSKLNGMMLESFPSSWENGGTWAGSMQSYLKLDDLNLSPEITVINSYDNNSANYQKMRFGLGSTLLGDGYFSFDFDVTNHGQTWWYDEYDADLGNPVSEPFNLLSSDRDKIQSGLWRRDFKNGIVLVNSTNKEQRYLFQNEEFEKLQGSQDKKVNNGMIINWVSMAPQDGLILYKRQTEINGATYKNGEFARIFDFSGAQPRNGFFSYQAAYPAGSIVLQKDGFSLNSYKGGLTVLFNSKEVSSFRPYGQFSGDIGLSAGDLNGDGKDEIITGAGPGGGPHVRVFSQDGKVLSSFFAYDKNFRGGVSVAAGDLNGDGKDEIITGAGPGGGPHVRVFSQDGKVLSSFFAYDQSFRGGVKVGYGYIDGEEAPRIFTFSNNF